MDNPVLLIDPDGKRVRVARGDKAYVEGWLKEVGLDEAFKVKKNGLIKSKRGFNSSELNNNGEKKELCNAFKEVVNDKEFELRIDVVNSTEVSRTYIEKKSEGGKLIYEMDRSIDKFLPERKTGEPLRDYPINAVTLGEKIKKATYSYTAENSVYLDEQNISYNMIILKPKENSGAAAFFHFSVDVGKQYLLRPNDFMAKPQQYYENLSRTIMKLGSDAAPRNIADYKKTQISQTEKQH